MGSGISTKYQIKTPDNNFEKKQELISSKKVLDNEKINRYIEKKLNQKPEEEANFSKNLMTTSQYYEMDSDGRFGQQGIGHRVRIVECDDVFDTAMDFYDHITEGCTIKQYKGEMKLYTVLDNYRINFRPYTSTQNSPAVDIFIEYPTRLIQKIHFVQR